MSYPITLTANNASLITPLMPNGILADGSIDSTTGISLIGRNYTNYGDAQNENFLHLLENFADVSPPTISSSVTIPLKGTLWYDTAGQRMRVYDGTNWSTVSERIVSNTAPTALAYTIKTGDQWYDSVNQQLNSWTGSSRQVVGPAYTASQGLSGAIVSTIIDTTNTSHTVVNNYTNGNLISITSYDSTFTPKVAIGGFSTVAPGINLLSNVTLNGTAINSENLGNVVAASYARLDIADTFASDVSVNGNIVLTYANIHYVNNSLVLHNHAYQGNVDVYMNSPLGNINSLHIDGSSGLATVYGNPVSSNGIANKNYVDTNIASANANLTTATNTLLADITSLSTSVFANISSIIASTDANLTTATNALQTEINNLNITIFGNIGQVITNSNAALSNVQASLTSNINTLSSSVTAQLATLTANASSQQSQINTINTTLPLLATTSNVNAAVANLAPINSPTFTGTPTAPTPTSGDNSTKVATTAFVNGLVGSGVPTGIIVMWNSTAASIPAGWQLCNGTNGTPDLRGQFIIGASAVTGDYGDNDNDADDSEYPVGDTGGASSANITISTSNLPAHTHTFNGSASISGTTNTAAAQISDPGHQHIDPYAEGGVPFTPVPNTYGSAGSSATDTDQSLYYTGAATTGISDAGHRHSFTAGASISGTTGATGLGTAISINTLPPFYALCYIQKMS